MAITAFSQWSTTAASNVDLNSIPLDGAVTTAGQLDDLFREMMKQLKSGVAPLATPTFTTSIQLDSGAAITALDFGTYTPTLTNTTNIDSSTASVCNYIQIGSMVFVSGNVAIDPTAAAATLLGMTIPKASNFSSFSQLSGAGSTGTGVAWQISGDITNDRATFSSTVTYTTNLNIAFNFMYRVI